MIRRSIPTRYGKALFRSKLEADWARAFDALGIQWRYEPEGRYFGDVFYLLDFHLPQVDQWVEVKGQWRPEDVRRALAFCSHHPRRPNADNRRPVPSLVYCGPDGAFHGWPALTEEVTFQDFLLDHVLQLVIVACPSCRAVQFAAENGSWGCLACGAADEWTLVPLHYRRLDTWPMAHRRAA